MEAKFPKLVGSQDERLADAICRDGRRDGIEPPPLVENGEPKRGTGSPVSGTRRLFEVDAADAF